MCGLAGVVCRGFATSTDVSRVGRGVDRVCVFRGREAKDVNRRPSSERFGRDVIVTTVTVVRGRI